MKKILKYVMILTIALALSTPIVSNAQDTTESFANVSDDIYQISKVGQYKLKYLASGLTNYAHSPTKRVDNKVYYEQTSDTTIGQGYMIYTSPIAIDDLEIRYYADVDSVDFESYSFSSTDIIDQSLSSADDNSENNYSYVLDITNFVEENGSGYYYVESEDWMSFSDYQENSPIYSMYILEENPTYPVSFFSVSGGSIKKYLETEKYMYDITTSDVENSDIEVFGALAGVQAYQDSFISYTSSDEQENYYSLNTSDYPTIGTNEDGARKISNMCNLSCGEHSKSKPQSALIYHDIGNIPNQTNQIKMVISENDPSFYEIHSAGFIVELADYVSIEKEVENLTNTETEVANPGDTLKYTITVNNPNGYNIAGIKISDPFADDEFQNQRVNSILVDGVNTGETTLENYLIDINANSTVTIEINTTLSSTVSMTDGQLDNEATITVPGKGSIPEYSLSDSATIPFENSNKKPIITANSEATVFVGTSNVDYINDFSVVATDDVDGDITSDVVVGDSSVDLNTVGDYQVKFNVTDSSGNRADEVISTLHVIKAPTTATYSAEITTDSDEYELVVGDSFDPIMDTNAKAHVYDQNGNEVIVEIPSVATNTVDTSVEGNYEISYEYTNSTYGVTANKTISVEVKEDEEEIVNVNDAEEDEESEIAITGSNGIVVIAITITMLLLTIVRKRKGIVK